MTKKEYRAMCTSPETFQEGWERYLPQATGEELSSALECASPHHPNENMRWLYDRILMEMFERRKRNDTWASRVRRWISILRRSFNILGRNVNG